MILGKRIKKAIKLVVLVLIFAVVYNFNPYQFEFLGHYDKIWAHRVNTLEKLSLSTPFFNGVELDLVYTNGVLDVTHPPAPSIDLSLETYLDTLDPADSLGLWLDIKNLDQSNAKSILEKIQRLLAKNDYPKSQLLIETRYPAALTEFLANGFRCSYYLPEGLHAMSAAQLSTNVRDIKQTLEAMPKLEISSHFRDYPVMAKHFTRPKNIWVTQHSRFKDYSAIRTLLKDPTVKTVLIRYKSLRGRR